jgi:cell wall-associated NlpC family hydrolase
MQRIKSIFSLLFLGLIFSIMIISCEYEISNKDKISAKTSILDTGSRFIIIQKDTTTIKPTVDSTLIDTVKAVVKVDSVIKPIAIPIVEKPIEKPVNKPASNMDKLAIYAKSLIKKPYAYGQNTPEKGFDNSGFVNHVFSKFNITVPRYSAAFVVAGNAVKENEATKGDILLFSKSESDKKVVNQVAIVISEQGKPISFIICSSGKTNGVVITNLNSYYKPRLMGVRRLGE